jgi:short-subunit dehydrogenase
MGTMQSRRRLAAVTGASSGIGYELARQFALNGYDLIVAAEDEDIARLPGDFAALGVTVQALRLDLATIEGVHMFHRAIASDHRTLDAIAINAGVGVCGDFARETSLAEELALIALNVTSSVHLAKLVLPAMIKRGHGRVLFTSSVAALMPTPYEAVYGASKSFVLAFASSLHAELKDTGVTVTSLIPGPTDTEFFHRAHMDDTQIGSEGKFENDASHVAFLGFQAMMAGEERVVAASMKTKVQAAIARFVPESLKAELHRKQAQHGSAHRKSA